MKSLKATANSAHSNALSGLMCKTIIGSDVKMPKLHDVIVKRQNDFDVIVHSGYGLVKCMHNGLFDSKK